MNPQILEFTISLQYMLEQMNEKELARFMQGKVLRYNGKLYAKNSGVLNDQAISSQQQDEKVRGDKTI